MKKTVTHLIVGLGKGGAETMLYQVLKYRTDPELTHRVISLGVSHYYEGPIRELGYEVFDVDLKSNPIRAFMTTCRLLKETNILCCWMYHANFLGYLAGRLTRVKKIIWCIRHSNLDPALNSSMTLRINRICARWSSKVSAVLYNGNRAREAHEAVGYHVAVGSVLDNGCDCLEYSPDSQAAVSLREELEIPEDKRIILSVTKNTAIKDIPTFLRAFAALRETHRDAVAVLCGSGVEVSSENLVQLCRKLHLVPNEDIHMLGMRHDVPRLLAACDLYVLHSAGEAFPNTLLQAMACGCLCVSTDVGDARRILAREERIVPPKKPKLLTAKLAEALTMLPEHAVTEKAANRRRVEEQFDIRKIVTGYEEKF